MSLRQGARLARSLKPPHAAFSRSLHQSSKRQFGMPESHYDPPTGWLFGVKPGEKPEKEGWENVFVYGFFGSIALFAVGYAFKPDTSIQTWALEEARRRLEKEGILEDSHPENTEIGPPSNRPVQAAESETPSPAAANL